MSNLIFKEHAPAYWAAGIPVIPLQAREKKPVISNWQAFADCMPSHEQQRDGWQVRVLGDWASEA